MNVINFSEKFANINLSLEELLILNSALNEICNGIDIDEFETRIGSPIKSVVYLLKQIGSILDNMDK